MNSKICRCGKLELALFFVLVKLLAYKGRSGFMSTFHPKITCEKVLLFDVSSIIILLSLHRNKAHYEPSLCTCLFIGENQDLLYTVNGTRTIYIYVTASHFRFILRIDYMKFPVVTQQVKKNLKTLCFNFCIIMYIKNL